MKKYPILIFILLAGVFGIWYVTSRNMESDQVVQVPAADAVLQNIYKNSSLGFSLRLPEGYTTDESYTYQALGPNKDIYGVKFTIPVAMRNGTNLSTDTYMSVEQMPLSPSCTAQPFIDDVTTPKMVTENGTTYSVASTSGAGAGNRYDETVYAISSTNPCIAVRYFIHYTAIENYNSDQVKAFDKQKLIEQFDMIRRSLIVR